jgi:hypothetical protein
MLCGNPRHSSVQSVRFIPQVLHALTLSLYRSLSLFVLVAQRRSSLRRTGSTPRFTRLGGLDLFFTD